MSALPPIAPVGVAAVPDALSLANALPNAVRAAGPGFSQILLDGVEAVNRRVASADAMVRSFTIDGSVPLHQVTFALEEARLSMELMMQVRARLVESYQRMMDMQL